MFKTHDLDILLRLSGREQYFNEPRALADLSKRVRAFLRPDEITKISRVVIIEKTNPALRAIASTMDVSHGLVEVSNSNFFGLAIKHGFVITAQVDLPPNKVTQRTAASGNRR